MSNELTRRSFFRGVVATVASTALVVEASPTEISQFSKGKVIDAYEVLPPDNKGDAVLYARNPDGQFVPWAYVTGMEASRESYDVTAFGDDHRVYHPYPQWIWSGSFLGIGALTIERFQDITYYNGYPFSVNYPAPFGRYRR